MVFPKPYVEEKKCENCNGTGWYKQQGFIGSGTFPCNVCNRTGKVKIKHSNTMVDFHKKY